MTAATNSDQTLAERLAEKVCSFKDADVTRKALEQSRAAIIDTIGVTLAGSREDCTQILLKVPGVAESKGASLIFGTDRRTSALDAAFVNGVASHALDYDDFSSVMGGHHSVPVVAPLFALGEVRKITGSQLIAAYVVGVEVEIRMARAVNFHHYDKGWHPTSTLGIFGAASAAAYLLRLTKEQTTHALAIAASMASGIKANFGTMTKPLHIGHCARDGLLAALLAERGFDANPAVFEHHQGFLNVFNGPGTFDANLMLDDWGRPLEIEGSSNGLKQFPCCGSTHPAIAMMLKLVDEEGIQPENVAKVQILPHGRRLRHTNNPLPNTSLEAKFSVQYAVARALISKTVRLKDFEGAAHLEPRIREILSITETKPHPDMADDSPQQWGAEVIVTTRDGKTLSRRVDELVGRGADNPMDSSEVWEKFYDCASRALPRESVPPLFERLETLEKVSDLAQVTCLLEVRALPGVSAFSAHVRKDAGSASEMEWVP
ncbi:MAG TPA: MmgE/PrpD family protein [Casimicrobiaceae bacterium]|nr:MmgE/PrpD family protein [Casimicrobiaceae bacterium]